MRKLMKKLASFATLGAVLVGCTNTPLNPKMDLKSRSNVVLLESVSSSEGSSQVETSTPVGESGDFEVKYLETGWDVANIGMGLWDCAHGDGWGCGAAFVDTAAVFFPVPGGASTANRMNKAAKVVKPYSRPANATTKAQRAAVQGKKCWECGAGGKMYADHKTPLVKEYYDNGGYINTQKMRDVKSVQPQCPTCSSRQGGKLKNYGKTYNKRSGKSGSW